MSAAPSSGWKRITIGLLLFGVSFGYIEAAVVDYLRLLKTEVVREAATLVMLGAVALAVSANVRQWVAALLVTFGVWDISFYAFLKLLLGWPRSWLTWDLLFLIPVPWVGPVLAPVVVSLSMVAAGFAVLGRDWAGRPVRLRPLHWLGILAGGAIIVLAFTWDHRNIMTGGMPNSFNWLLFMLGEAIGLAVFLHAVWSPRSGAGSERRPR